MRVNIYKFVWYTATMELRRWTPLTALVPQYYVDSDVDWEGFDLRDWSATSYDWSRDPWNGYRDFAKRPEETIADGAGDCEDYALVAASWALAHGRSGVGLGFCWEWPYPWPRHVIAFDETNVYSSGDITEGAVNDYLERSEYDYCLRRRIG